VFLILARHEGEGHNVQDDDERESDKDDEVDLVVYLVLIFHTISIKDSRWNLQLQDLLTGPGQAP
jgi:hypothetical protein